MAARNRRRKTVWLRSMRVRTMQNGRSRCTYQGGYSGVDNLKADRLTKSRFSIRINSCAGIEEETVVVRNSVPSRQHTFFPFFLACSSFSRFLFFDLLLEVDLLLFFFFLPCSPPSSSLLSLSRLLLSFWRRRFPGSVGAAAAVDMSTTRCPPLVGSTVLCLTTVLC